MKQWLSIFSAVLVAGLLVFGVYRLDVQADRQGEAWDEMADLSVRALVAVQRRQDLDPADTAVKKSIRETIESAEALLAQKPPRAKKAVALKIEMDRARWRVQP